eukprot:5106972-Alexandrium_andersonii.AAC.1
MSCPTASGVAGALIPRGFDPPLASLGAAARPWRPCNYHVLFSWEANSSSSNGFTAQKSAPGTARPAGKQHWDFPHRCSPMKGSPEAASHCNTKAPV